MGKARIVDKIKASYKTKYTIGASIVDAFTYVELPI